MGKLSIMSVILDQELKRPFLLAGTGWPNNIKSVGKKFKCEVSSTAYIMQPTLARWILQDFTTRITFVITVTAGVQT